MPPHASRLKKLRQLIRRNKVDALLVTSFTNVTYLTGFTGDDSYLLITLDDERLITDPRYTAQLEEECEWLSLRVRQPGELMMPIVAEEVRSAGIDKLGVEADAMTLGTHRKLAEQSEGTTIEPLAGIVESLRLIKDRGEIDEIRRACVQARRALEVIRAAWTPEATEKQIAHELEHQARKFGAKGLSFPAIIAAGPRGALPHATPTDACVGEHQFTLIDWGTFDHLYASDLTRMVVTAKPSKRFAKVYNTVLEAQLAGIAAIRPGITCEKVDAAARSVIIKAGYGKAFGHGLGHGLGMEVHEAPSLSRKQKTELRPGMVVTVEPGIYLPGWGGIRIEDDVLVTKTGYELLSDVPKRLEDCIV